MVSCWKASVESSGAMGCASSSPLVEGGKNLLENAKETKDNAIAAGEKVMQDAGETVSSGVETVKHAVESGLNKAQDSIGTVVNSIGNTMHSTKEHATDAVEHIDSAIEDAAHKTHETMDEAISDAKTVLVGEEDRAKDIDTLSTTATLDKEDDMKHEFGEPVEEVESQVVEALHVEDIEHNAEVQEETATLEVKKEE